MTTRCHFQEPGCGLANCFARIWEELVARKAGGLSQPGNARAGRSQSGPQLLHEYNGRKLASADDELPVNNLEDCEGLRASSRCRMTSDVSYGRS